MLVLYHTWQTKICSFGPLWSIWVGFALLAWTWVFLPWLELLGSMEFAKGFINCESIWEKLKMSKLKKPSFVKIVYQPIHPSSSSSSSHLPIPHPIDLTLLGPLLGNMTKPTQVLDFGSMEFAEGFINCEFIWEKLKMSKLKKPSFVKIVYQPIHPPIIIIISPSHPTHY